MASDLLHHSVGSHGCCIHREGPHHANHISFVERFPASESVLLLKAGSHVRVFQFPKLVRLHQSLDVVKGIVKHPVHGASQASGNEGYINRHLVVVSICRRQCFGDLFDDCEVEAEACRLSYCSGPLSPVEAPEAVLLEDLDCCIDGTIVDLVGLSSLDLDSYPGVFDGALDSYGGTTPREEMSPVPKAARVLSTC